MARRSVMYEHFTDVHGDKKVWRCKHCHKDVRANVKKGTSNLRKHFNKCCNGRSSSLPQPQPQLQPSGPPGESSDCEPAGPEEDVASRDLARMIAFHGYDPSVVEDDYFKSFVGILNPGFEVPSREAIEEMCDDIFDEARTDSISRLRSAPGRISLSVGKLKTTDAWGVMYIACSFIDDQWKLHKVVTDAVVPAGHHYFEDGPILGVDVVSDGAAEYLIHFISQHEDRLSRVAYYITDNDIHAGLKDYIEEINFDRSLSCTATTYMDNVLHSIARCLLPNSDFRINMNDDMMGLDLTRQERQQLFSELGLDYEWAYDERWCACYCSLQVLRKRGFPLVQHGKLLCKVWEQVYCSIQIISASTCPTSNLCLVELFKLREILQDELARFSGDYLYDQDGYVDYSDYVNAKGSIEGARSTLDEAIQDSYLVWSVPLALDPRYKLSFIEFSFKRAFRSQATKYVSQVTAKINKLYADYIKKYGTITAADHSDSTNNAMIPNTRAHPLEQAWDAHCRSQETQQTELDRYLQDPPAPNKDFDVLNWWKENNCKYPTVARMARDALAMPTCSKLSSDQLAQVKSILRDYSKKPYGYTNFSANIIIERGET